MNSLIAEQPASPLVFMAEKLLELAASQTIDDESHVALLREALQSMAIAEARTAKALTECIPTPAKSSRAGYLRALLEVIGDRPDHSWHQEWASMLMELKQNNGELKKREDGKWVSIRDVQWGSCVVAEGDVINEAWIEKHESISILSDATQSAAKSWTTDAIASMEGAGWTRVDAQRMVLLLVPRTAICRALRDQDRCYAAATYALCEVFATKAAEQGRRGLRPPVVYRLLCGSPSALAGADEALARLEEPDATGFRGLCSLLAVRGDSNPVRFTPEGMTIFDVATQTRVVVDGPVVAFERGSEDEHGYHAGVVLEQAGVPLEQSESLFPPNCLFRLKRVQPDGFLAPGGVWVEQKLLVSATCSSLQPSARRVAGGAGRRRREDVQQRADAGLRRPCLSRGWTRWCPTSRR